MVSVLVVGTNTYQLQAAASALLEDNILAHTAWTALASDDKDRALITAFNVLEGIVWQGEKTGTAQHPRTGLTNCNGDDISSASTAPDILMAQAVLAYEYSQDPSLAGSSATGAQLKRAKAGSAEVEFFQKQVTAASGALDAISRLPLVVKDLIKCYTAAGDSAGIAGPTITGTGRASGFSDCDYDLNGGYA